ncbi:MAG TPA: hypothetical protein P5239_03540, partial [Victivallales bacterium]|nr:hypothetical protein [Victivallales bacterium]
MIRLSPFGKILVFLILCIGSLIFSTPLIWMLSTALKPIEQTMSMPPTWLPYRYYCFLNKKIVYLIPKQKIEMPSIVLKSKADNNIIIIPKNELDQQ